MMRLRLLWIVLVMLSAGSAAVMLVLAWVQGLGLCVPPGPIKAESAPAYTIIASRSVEDFAEVLAQFDTVFWDPRDTISLRSVIRQSPGFSGKTVLEIGTGTGLLSLCCLRAGARHVIATDVNPAAVANARHNAGLLGVADRLEVRPVPLEQAGAYSVVGHGETFDYIISNPPWEDSKPRSIDEYALYDESFGLLRSLLEGLKDHLRPEGKAYLAYGCVDAIRQVQRSADYYGLSVRVLDDRDLDALPNVFLPGMLLEITPNCTGTPIRRPH